MMSSNDQRQSEKIFNAVRAGDHVDLANLIDSDINLNLKDTNDDNGDTPLHVASSNGHVGCVHTLISLEVNLDERNNYGHTALCSAAKNGHLACVMALLDAGASFDFRNEYDVSGLCDAEWNRHLECVVVIMEKRSVSGDDVSDRMLRGLQYMSTLRANRLSVEEAKKDAKLGLKPTDILQRAALFYASILGQPQCLRALIDIGLDVNMKQYSTGHTSLFAAALCGNTQCINVLTKAGADVNVTDKEGKSALLVSVGNGYHDCVKALVDAGADVNWKNKQGESAIYMSTALGDLDCLRILTEAGANVDLKHSRRETALFEAVRKNDEECVDILINAGANVNARDINGETPITCGQFETLIYAGANIHARSKYDKKVSVKENWANLGAKYDNCAMNDIKNPRAIVRAAWNGRHECATSLIASGADVNVIETDGTTALIAAAWEGHLQCIEIILSVSNIDVNSKDFSDRTALYAAACDGHVECVTRILAHTGVDINIANKIGVTPLMIAAEKGKTDCVKVLIKAGANAGAMDIGSRTAASYATYQGNAECLQAVLQAPSAVCQIDPCGEILRLLGIAISGGHVDCVELLAQYAPASLRWDDRSFNIIQHCTAEWSENKHCLSHLLKAGIFQWRWFTQVLYNYPEVLLHELVISGFAPGHFLDQQGRRCTPLVHAFVNGDYKMIQYLVANLYLTPMDITILQNNRTFAIRMQQVSSVKVRELYHNYSSTPWRLEILAFIQISANIKRNYPVKQKEKLGWEKLASVLPEKFVKRLKFEHPIRHLCIQDWDTLRGDFLQTIWPNFEDLVEPTDCCMLCVGKCMRPKCRLKDSKPMDMSFRLLIHGVLRSSPNHLLSGWGLLEAREVIEVIHSRLGF